MGKILNYNLIIAGFLTILGVEGVCLYNLIKKENSVNPQSNRRLQRTEIQSKNLLLNRDDQVYFITNKNEEQGIKDIKEIINTSDYEEAWLYFPEKQKWYEVADKSFFNEKTIRSGAEIDKEIIKKILEKNKDVKEFIFYHNHPSILKNTNRISPSIDGDLEWLKLNTLDFPDHKIKHKICSEYGITEYYLTEKAIKEFSSKDSIKLRDYYSYMKDSSITLNPEYFTINFKPHENKKNEK